MKLIVLKIMIIVIKLSNIANLSNLRTSSNLNATYNNEETSNLFNDDKTQIKDDQMHEDKLDIINFDYVLLNLNIIEQKIDEFKSKLKGNH